MHKYIIKSLLCESCVLFVRSNRCFIREIIFFIRNWLIIGEFIPPPLTITYAQATLFI